MIGQRIRATCSGFTPRVRVRVYWQDIGALVAVGAAADGSASAYFLVPPVSPGPWRVRVADSSGASARFVFTVRAPSLTLAPAYGPNGAAFTARLRGFRAGEAVAIRWYALTGASYALLTPATVSSTGARDAALTVPSGAGRGAHRVEGVGQTSGLVAASTFTVTKPAETRYLDQGTPGCMRVAFIFDVGIGYPLDTGVLDTLQRNGVPATMFLMGWWADANPAVASRIATDGYVIGSHGYAAQELTTRSDEEVVADIQAAAKAISRATGSPPALWFTPYAAEIDARVQALIASQGYVPVGWRVAAADYDTTATEEAVYERVVDGVYDGAIVEFHIDGPATRQSTGLALPRVIATLRERGYHFVTVPEMALRCPVAAATPTRAIPAAPPAIPPVRDALRPATPGLWHRFVTGSVVDPPAGDRYHAPGPPRATPHRARIPRP